MLSVAAHSAEPEMSPWPCPHDTLHCHQKVVSIPPGKPGEILVWSGNDFVWVVACATVDPAGDPVALTPQATVQFVAGAATQLAFLVPPSNASAGAPIAPAVQVASRSTGPETLAGQLELQCPERHPPRYPPTSRREREQGEVRMKVEIDELGRIESVAIVESSGSARLDDAARDAIRSWRCQPAEREGRPVKAVALQTMAFVLEHR